MSDFQLRFEWEDSPRVRTPELDATWARLEIYAEGEPITRVEARRTQSVRTGIYVPLFPIAEWMIANWWFLWDEWRANGRDGRHSLLAAREGFVLPDLSFVPTETKMEVMWWPSASTLSARSSSDVLFLSGGSSIVPKAHVKEEFRRLVEAVIERLSARQVQHSYLVPEWRAILDAEHDPEQKAFCEKAARLGCDPFDVADSLAAQIEHLGVLLPEPMAEDFCDAIPLAQMTSGAQAVKTFIDSASATAVNEGKWREFREKSHWRRTEAPWRDGYNEARVLRAYLGRSGAIATGLDSFLKQAFGSLEIREFEVASRIEAISAPTQTGAPLFGYRSHRREESKRFILCRALSDHLASGQPSLVTRSATEHQQRNRAFAAEFLAPAESIRERIGADRVGEEDIEDLAQEFQVSDLVIRHQIENHNLTWLGA
ncbi:MAG TPA: hypothetical protein VNY05_44390 [Candidatus Acidoferrales bacterium]|jgi:hypothetical protein|nr:hypothetical protein [Candidatus Acidoferrales bacterium]